ncbi:Serine--tRNA ligase, mitochondrial [Elasticomyces elasticus]|uniref:serine--tRNA ligase n=1 Tax=Exophiala sideris TaxID=1016849 RepID=A0ABR0J148_9EURO|nr:Serine--tRNA ligase, mitochondrial [Elasticomyces elasticus]KAK5023901.1 Serine--tRNA ligase, mitochondrial [Exophiala sideris]KAK5030082.1 Serine--tRNA ligase, mitochondrial [Exophiala sideris]KAK5053577.1 Serine--tRNA ligase, mitochondrial [Exophiala sideris]KAK5179380.1 Serine--tRNA ligase, mitochondrial [Eurotiomycetes sp. CCFEE 6388]
MSKGRLDPRTFLLRCRRAYATAPAPKRERPATAPNQTPPLRQIRDNVELYGENTVVRNYRNHRDVPRKIADNLRKMNELNERLKGPREEYNNLQALLYRKESDQDDIIPRMKTLKLGIDELQFEHGVLDAHARAMALSLPNLTSSQTPTNNEPRLQSYINYNPENPPSYDSSADHALIGEKLKLIDFASASTATGWGFYYLLNEAALLEQALVQYALSVALKHGWSVATPPSLVYSHMADACGFQPRDQNDEQQIWQVAQTGKDVVKPPRSLAATAEIPLAGMYAGKAIREEDLPVKLVGPSRCFRAEAGARGVDTKGLYRVHEFTKVEMFAWTNSPPARDGIPEEEVWTKYATEVFDEMVGIQTEILESLGLPCRVLEMPSSDLGASAYRKIDIEAMFPSRKAKDGGWGEVTSVSICTDYQSRRLDTRILEANATRKKFPHTVNGTAIAVPRVLAAILENGWREKEGCVVIPEVLRRYMSGMETISSRGKDWSALTKI